MKNKEGSYRSKYWKAKMESYRKEIERIEDRYVDDLEIKMAGLRLMLKRHGGHASECMKYMTGDCSCGWNEIAKGLE